MPHCKQIITFLRKAYLVDYYVLFSLPVMKGNSTYNIRQFCSSIVMMLALVWLTVSTPFVYAAQQQISSIGIVDDICADIDEETNPFANTTEEKTESGGNTLSEYLHDMHQRLQYVAAVEKYSKCHPSDLYYAFHPELISPPPEVSLV